MSSLKPIPVASINLKTPLQFGAAGAFDVNTTTLDAIGDDLKILLDTNWGERVINYYYGANLRALLFSPSQNLNQQITDAITAAIDKWMPYVAIRNITITTSDQDTSLGYNSVRVRIIFSVGQTGLQGDVTTVI